MQQLLKKTLIYLICGTIVINSGITVFADSATINITNFEKTSVPEKYKAQTEQAIYNSIRNLIDSTRTTPINVTVQDREPKKNLREQLSDISFNIDIPDLEQTLKVRVVYTNKTTANEIMITCPEDGESAYPNSTCTTDYTTKGAGSSSTSNSQNSSSGSSNTSGSSGNTSTNTSGSSSSSSSSGNTSSSGYDSSPFYQSGGGSTQSLYDQYKNTTKIKNGSSSSNFISNSNKVQYQKTSFDSLEEKAKNKIFFFENNCIVPSSLLNDGAAGFMPDNGDNVSFIWNYIVENMGKYGYNFSPEVIAGMIGNFRKESYSDVINPFLGNGTRFGIYQGSKDLAEYMAQDEVFSQLSNPWVVKTSRYPESVRNSKMSTQLARHAIALQIDFMLQGGNGDTENGVAYDWKEWSQAYNKDSTTLTGNDAVEHYAKLFRKEFERNKYSAFDVNKRVKYAQEVYERYVNGALADIAASDPNFSLSSFGDKICKAIETSLFGLSEELGLDTEQLRQLLGQYGSGVQSMLALIQNIANIPKDLAKQIFRKCNNGNSCKAKHLEQYIADNRDKLGKQLSDMLYQYAQIARAVGMEDYNLGDCGKFVGMVLRATVDPEFQKSGTGNQLQYFKEHPEKWLKVFDQKNKTNNNSANFTEADLVPGDVLIERGDGKGHIWIYMGNGKIAEASWDDRIGNITDYRDSCHGRYAAVYRFHNDQYY